MILYQHASPFPNFLNFLAANGFSIGGSSRQRLLVIKAIIRQIGCRVELSTRSRLPSDANHGVDPQDAQVCSSCLIEFGAVWRKIGFQTAAIPNDLMPVRCLTVIQIVLVRASEIVRGAGEGSIVGAFEEWLGRRVWHQHLLGMLQKTSDTRMSREMSISTEMSSPDISPVWVQALKWSRVLWPYKLAISKWSAMTATNLLPVSLQLFQQTNVLRSGASNIFWCSLRLMRLLAVSLLRSQHQLATLSIFTRPCHSFA
jgi:hypothetical protein